MSTSHDESSDASSARVESATFQRRPYSPTLTESPIVISRMIRSTAIDFGQGRARIEGVDTERVSVHAIQTTHGKGNVNMPPR